MSFCGLNTNVYNIAVFSRENSFFLYRLSMEIMVERFANDVHSVILFMGHNSDESCYIEKDKMQRKIHMPFQRRLAGNRILT